MCLICIDWIKGKLTTKEAWSNLNEMMPDTKNKEELNHYYEVATKLAEAEKKEKK